MSDNWEIVRRGIISDTFGSRQVNHELAALQRLKDQHDADQKRIKELQAAGTTAIELLHALNHFYEAVVEVWADAKGDQ